MSFFKKTKEAPKLGRIQKLSDAELIQWADNCILQLGYTFDQWRYHEHPLEDVALQASGLNDILKELLIRVANKES